MPASQVLIAGSTFAISDGSTTVPASAVETGTVTATSGSLIIGYSGGFGAMFPATQLTTPLTIPTTTVAIAAALVALKNIGNNKAGLPNVAVTGTPAAPIVTFQNDLVGQPVPLLTTDATSTLTGGTVTWAMTTLGVAAGGVYAALARLTTLVFPNTKRDVKEVTSFDSTGYTKEYIGGFINPGDVAVDAHWTGDVTQDYNVGLIAKFYGGANYACRTNVPNKVPYPGGFTPGLQCGFGGFFTDGTPAGAKHDDIFTVKGSIQISGLPTFQKAVQ